MITKYGLGYSLSIGLESLPLEVFAGSSNRRRSIKKIEDRAERAVPQGSMESSTGRRVGVTSSRDVSAPTTVLATQGYRASPPRMAWGGFTQPPWAGGHADEAPVAPRPVRGDSPPLWFDSDQNSPYENMRPLYGRFVGPIGKAAYADERPATYVDMAAWYHDREYAAIYQHHGFKNDLGWPFPFEFTDKGSTFQLDLARSDFRLAENSWGFIGQGIDNDFYDGSQGLLHFLGDVYWTQVITTSHVWLGAVRLVFYGVKSILDDLERLSARKINFGDFLGNIVGTAVQIVLSAAYAVFGVARGVLTFGVSLVKSVGRMIERGTGEVRRVLGESVGSREGAAKGAVLGAWIGGPVGAIIGGAIGGGHCFITTAASATLSLQQADALLLRLRHFRDTYVRSREDGAGVISEYYRLAPKIVRAIQSRPDSERVWAWVTAQYLIPAMIAARSYRSATAFALYVQMIDRLGEMAHRYDLPPADRWSSRKLLSSKLT